MLPQLALVVAVVAMVAALSKSRGSALSRAKDHEAPSLFLGGKGTVDCGPSVDEIRSLDGGSDDHGLVLVRQDVFIAVSTNDLDPRVDCLGMFVGGSDIGLVCQDALIAVSTYDLDPRVDSFGFSGGGPDNGW